MQNKSNRIVSVIIVTSGVKDYLKSCLDSVREQIFPPIEIIVIDNSLNQNFSQEIIQHYPGVKLCSQQRNLSYCEALNLGIKQSQGDFILCLNDDVILDRGFIEEALKGFIIDERIGMVSGKILRSDRGILDCTGLFLSLWRTAKERGYGAKDKGQFEKEGYVFGVNGAVAFYCKAMLEEIKENGSYFDSDFRFFYEDLDVAWRAQRFGWKGYYIPQAIAYHVRGGTARPSCGIDKPYARIYLSERLHADLIKNRYLTIIKNESDFGFWLHFPAVALYDFVMWSYILLFRTRLIKPLLLNWKFLKSAFKKRG